MSFPKNDRNFWPKAVKVFPEGQEYDEFVSALSKALKAEFGGSPAAVKSIGRLTHSNERAVRNWFEGRNCPSAHNLVRLIQHSDQVLRAVLQSAGRSDLAIATEVRRFKDQLRNLLDLLEEPSTGEDPPPP